MSWRKRWLPRAAPAAMALVLPLVGCPQPARAEPLPKEACDSVAAEHAQLFASGVPDILSKGPSWAKANVAAAKLKDVERYIAVQETLLFRCGLAKQRQLTVPDPDEPEAAPAKEGTAPTAAAVPRAAPATPLPKRRPTQPRAAPPREPEGAAAPAAEKPKAPSRTRAKSKESAKAKPDDAYRPPVKAKPAD
ncbi:MAG: hypothetical protein AB7F78_13720 [Hyphomicrobiaceae bacterium]